MFSLIVKSFAVCCVCVRVLALLSVGKFRGLWDVGGVWFRVGTLKTKSSSPVSG